MKSRAVFAVALAAALTPFAANAMEVASATRMVATTIAGIASNVDHIGDASEAAQAEVGFPAMPTPQLVSSRPFNAIVARHAAANGVPIDLAHAVIEVESNYRPGVRGRAGEVGLMQIKPATARGVGFRGTVRSLFDPETNIKYGMKYLGEAHRLGGGTVCGTILKYNAGHAARRMNKVSSAYCGKVKRLLSS
jgi:soluble lytic murein transglycosylase-like protein